MVSARATPSSSTSTLAVLVNFCVMSRLYTLAVAFNPRNGWYRLLTTTTDASSYEYCTCSGSFAFRVPKYPPAGIKYQSYRCQIIDGHALFSIHWITPVDVYLFLPYASNIARSPSYVSACDFSA